MRIFYDTEFIEDGSTIDLVSIGMVADDGRDLYAVSAEFDQGKLLADPWLVENVWPSLPIVEHKHGGNCRCSAHKHGQLDLQHPDVRSRAQIARLVADFIQQTPQAELWASFAAYDHVALCQLWGRMIDLPGGVPMFTRDLQHEVERICKWLGRRELQSMPVQTEGHHNALADARYNKAVAMHLDDLESLCHC